MLREIEIAPPFVKLYPCPECHGSYGYQNEEESTKFV
jgi:hypothetical protein